MPRLGRKTKEEGGEPRQKAPRHFQAIGKDRLLAEVVKTDDPKAVLKAPEATGVWGWYQKALRDPRLRWVIIALTIAYLLSPIDLVPNFIPFVGYVDDALVLSIFLYEICCICIEYYNKRKANKAAQAAKASHEEQMRLLEAQEGAGHYQPPPYNEPSTVAYAMPSQTQTRAAPPRTSNHRPSNRPPKYMAPPTVTPPADDSFWHITPPAGGPPSGAPNAIPASSNGLLLT